MTASNGPNPPPFGPPSGQYPQQYPPVFFPPPMYYPPQPSRGGGGGFARAIFTTLAVSILGFSITLNIYLLIAQGFFSGSAGSVGRTVITDGDTATMIAVVPVHGAIRDKTATHFREILKELEADASLKAIVIDMNSPGGTVTASDDIYEQILDFKRNRGIPIFVAISELGTSGGYYVSCAADQVFAQRTTWTGNIGVLIPRINLAKLGEKYGIEDQTVTSTGATFKNAGSPLKSDTPEQTAYWQGLTDEAFAVFKSVVMTGRKLDQATVDRIANGKVYTGNEALKLKLVDSIGNLEDAVGAAAARAGVSRPHVVRLERHLSFMEALSGEEKSESALGSIRVGNTEVKLDQRLLDNIISPRPLYLWSGQ
ncbi:MAG: signal peptide peptidase SppA [Burkholderiales bacterium]|nr:signal peptide peptidase SppA [Phycisphaerae bacterium]